MAPKTPPAKHSPTKTLLLRLCKHSFQSTGKEDISPPVEIDMEEVGDLKTEKAWEVLEKAICSAFDVRQWAHRPRIHHHQACLDEINPNELSKGKFSFDKVYLISEMCDGVGMENDEPDWEADPARGFLEEFDREMEVKREEERRRIREVEVEREAQMRREMEVRRRLWQNQRILREWDEKQRNRSGRVDENGERRGPVLQLRPCIHAPGTTDPSSTIASIPLERFNLRTPSGWQALEAMICITFHVDMSSYKAYIHHDDHDDACEDVISAEDLLDSGFDFEGEVYLVHF
ncbi:hypothetical protein PRZ48_004012 [Zasmidium cellare]|uniref:Uncharacterized protein n=1 Tax=Zasmidium cellare TaxID=395010 RepID=A0ABR0EX21_ZASCE|nr:hypothetical protein PRZ48_004012 [Zasmidium cellare]